MPVSFRIDSPPSTLFVNFWNPYLFNTVINPTKRKSTLKFNLSSLRLSTNHLEISKNYFSQLLGFMLN